MRAPRSGPFLASLDGRASAEARLRASRGTSHFYVMNQAIRHVGGPNRRIGSLGCKDGVVGADQVPTVTVADIPAALPDQTSQPAAGELFLLDVREPDEWAAGHIDGAAHIPMGEVTGRLDEIPRSARVIAVCRSGRRSAMVTAYLVDGGWNAHNLEGGMVAWAGLGRAMTAETSAPPVVL